MNSESNSSPDFEVYLKSKKIDPQKFKTEENTRYEEFKLLFDQIHPDSFTQQKLFLINRLRREYLLEEVASEGSTAALKKTKPKILAKPKLS